MNTVTERQPEFLTAYRWRMVALLFFATTVNYIDRNVLSFTMIDEAFRRTMLGLPDDAVLTATDINTFKERMGYVDAAFKTAYALGFLLVGWFIDRVGTRKGFSFALVLWSLAGIGTAFVNSVRSLSIGRFLLGIGEAGNFPSSVKSVAEWFPKKERAFATGVFNAGSNVGIIVTALAVPWLTMTFGWRAAFVITGLLGFVVLWLWLRHYHSPEAHPNVSAAELAYIRSDSEEINASSTPVSWRKLLTYRQTWALAICRFLADPIWYFYLTWLPDFFNSGESLDRKLDLKSIGIPFLVIYLVSDAGSIFFGWLSSRLIARGWEIGKARKFTLLLCALCVVPIFFASHTGSVVVAIALISLATAAHQGWSANIYTMGSDLFPKHMVSSVIGIGGMFGATGGILLAASAGVIRVNFGYTPLFVIAGSSYLLAWIILNFLLPQWKGIQTTAQ